jgi:hypothetical protein
MCSELATMKRTMSGNTTLEDNDSDASVNFQIKAYEQVFVFGQVGGSHEENYLKFSFQTDQTCIEPLLADFHKLLKMKNPEIFMKLLTLFYGTNGIQLESMILHHGMNTKDIRR